MAIRHWFVTWFQRRRASVVDCPSCDGVLELCPSCKGAWRQGPCRSCRIGMVCTKCRNQWVVD